jgi:hypothetical protein
LRVDGEGIGEWSAGDIGVNRGGSEGTGVINCHGTGGSDTGDVLTGDSINRGTEIAKPVN